MDVCVEAHLRACYVVQDNKRGERGNEGERGGTVGEHLALPREHEVGVPNTVHHHNPEENLVE